MTRNSMWTLAHNNQGTESLRMESCPQSCIVLGVDPFLLELSDVTIALVYILFCSLETLKQGTRITYAWNTGQYMREIVEYFHFLRKQR